MARHSGPKQVQCYHCGHRMEVSARAESTNCSGCNKAIFVGDLVINKMSAVSEKRTCGKIIVEKKGRIIAKLVEAGMGIECHGIIDAEKVVTGGKLLIGPKATFKGSDTHAHTLELKQGAKVQPTFFNVPSDPKGLLNVDKQEEKQE